MIVNIGSKNPNKFNAVREAFLLFTQFQNAHFESVDADSDISNQPVGLEETITGALNRSKNAFKACSFAVGLESGIVPVPMTRTGHMNLSVCVIYDGNRQYTGIGPAFELPDAITRLVIHNNLELDEAIVKSGFSQNPRIGYSEGIIGILTDGIVTRKDYMVPAVTMAMAQLLPELKQGA